MGGSVMRRCVRCGRVIWPWQPFGQYTISRRERYYWHAGRDCRDDNATSSNTKLSSKSR